MLPSTTRLADVVSTFKKATSCRSCGRSPSSSSRKTEGNNDNPKDDGIVHRGIRNQRTASNNPAIHYDGALLVSPSCGHFFCRGCWDRVAANNDDRTVHCPVCQHCTGLDPRPIIPSLMGGCTSKSAGVFDEDYYSGEVGVAIENAVEAPESPVSSSLDVNVSEEDNIEQLGALLGMLRQLRGAPNNHAREEHGTVQEAGGIAARKGADDNDGIPEKEAGYGDAQDEANEHETEVPGTCLSFNDAIRKISGTNADSGGKSISTNHHQMEELSITKSHQHATACVGEEGVAETPTVRGSQISSIRLSSIKNGGKKDDGEDNFIRALEETEVPGTNLSPPRITSNERLYQLKNVHSQSPAKTKSPTQSIYAPEENETEVPCTLLSPLRKNLNEREYELKFCNYRSPEKANDPNPLPGEAPEDNDTEVPGTFLSPLRYNSAERRYELMPCNSELPEKEESTQLLGWALEGNETEVPGTSRFMLRDKSDSSDHQLKLCDSEPYSQQPASLERDITKSAIDRNGDGRFEPEFYQSDSLIKQGDTEVPGSLLPRLANHASVVQALVRSQVDSVDPVESKKVLSNIDNDSSGKPRRVSTSPNKMKRKEDALKPQSSGNTALSKKRPREDNASAAIQTSKELIVTDIRPWNIHSEPIMSQLTCDVKTGTMRPPDHTTHGDPLTNAGNIYLSPEKQTRPSITTTPGDMKRKLYVAFDVIDSVETHALKSLHEQGLCHVVLDGVHGVGKGPEHGESFSPFPAILLTHAFDEEKPGQKQSTISTCYRSYSYLKAKALGARIVDARWAVDSQNAGILLDSSSYKICFDLESYHGENFSDDIATAFHTVPGKESSMMLSHRFDGITFGLLQGHECKTTTVLDGSECQPIRSPLHVETKPTTAEEIESLVQCWGGRATTDELTHIDLLLVDDCMTLYHVVKTLQHKLRSNGDVRRWSIENWQKNELDDFIVDGCLTRDCGDGIHVRIPIVRTKWFEDSITLNSLLCLHSYCWGILCL